MIIVHIFLKGGKYRIFVAMEGTTKFWKGKKKIFFQKRGKKKTCYRWKGHNGFGRFLAARFRVSASCQYWQVLKTFWGGKNIV